MRRTALSVGSARPAFVLLVVLSGAGPFAHAQQISPDQAALLVLNSARRAYNEGKHDFAARRFREFLRLYGGHKGAASAHHGLAMCLMAGPRRDYAGAVRAFQEALRRGEFPEKPSAQHGLAAALRALGRQATAQAAAQPSQAQRHRDVARRHFEEAARQFAAAATAFAARVKTPPASAPAKAPQDLQWAARARCDHCEMLLRLGRFTEAKAAASAFLADKATAAAAYRDLARYQLGYACFALGEALAAGRALSRLAPFRQDFGVHARYLLARVHHLAKERPEAAAQYAAVRAGHRDRVEAARVALRNPQALTPQRRAQLEARVRGPPPDYVPRAAFYAALLLAEQGQFAEALKGFSELIQQYPKFELAAEARARQGYCLVELRSFPEATRVLQPLSADPQLRDRALWWLGRAQVGAANPADPQAYARAVAGAIESFRQAADLAGKRAAADATARARRADILIELADAQRLAGQHQQAATTYRQVYQERGNPDRLEEALQRQAVALHLAGRYAESDNVCRQFEQTFPRSTLLPSVLFRSAENAYLMASAAKAANPRDRRREEQRWLTEAIRRYRRMVQRFPDFAHVHAARQGIGAAYYRLGRLDEAMAALAKIPETERTGPLAAVSYLEADCLIRSFPARTDDALRAAQLLDRARRAAKLLEGFAATQPKGPTARDALGKLGRCYRRIASVLADPAERKKTYGLARSAYDRFLQAYAKDPSAPEAMFGRACCQAEMGEVNPAINELRRFTGEPLRGSAVAPLALAHLSALLRAQRRAPEAEGILRAFRAQSEAALLKDPARREWAAVLQHEHALALKDSGKPEVAADMFDAAAKQFPEGPVAANAVWRAGQCRREVLAARLAAARAAAGKPGAPPQEVAAARQAARQSRVKLRQTVDALEAAAENLSRSAPGTEPHLRMLYEVAWCWRALADAETAAARARLQQAALEKIQAAVARQLPAGGAPPQLLPPALPPGAVPVQPSEMAARNAYKRLLTAASPAGTSGEPPLAAQVRLELAEMHAQRGADEQAARLLAEALAKGPPPALAVRLRLRLAAALLARQDAAGAIAQLKAVGTPTANDLLAEQRLLGGEALFQRKEWAKAVERLVPFRDQGPFQNLPRVTDRALLTLGRACAQLGQWEPARRTFEMLVNRFRTSPWADEAYCQMGHALQRQKRYDQAVQTYAQVVRRTAAECAAEAQVGIGLCRLAQQRHAQAVEALLAVPFTYDYPRWTAQARHEAARAYLAMGRRTEAAGLWRQVVKDHADTEWAAAARKELAKLK